MRAFRWVANLYEQWWSIQTSGKAEWKKQLLDRASEVFDKEKKSSEPDVKELQIQ